MEILLKHGTIISDDKLHINDDVKTNNYMLKFLYIATGFSLAASGFNVYINVSKPLLILFILLLIYDIIILIAVYKRSTAIEINFDEIKKVSLKDLWFNNQVIRLELINGKRRIIGNFKNFKDAETFYKYLLDKVSV